jgi:hypothetical protein
MSLNTDGLFVAPASPQLSKYDGVKLPPLVIPDGRGPWALRYIWVKHKERNDEFVANYFNKGNNAEGSGLNLRKQTTHMQEVAWNPHNNIFEKSRDNGNLIWRVKVHNHLADTIDYIEMWRSKEIIKETFGWKRTEAEAEAEPETDDNTNNKVPILGQSTSELARSPEEIIKLRKGLDEAGFEPRAWATFPTVHPLVAMRWYLYFVSRHKEGKQCVINTGYNKELNPWEPFQQSKKETY